MNLPLLRSCVLQLGHLLFLEAADDDVVVAVVVAAAANVAAAAVAPVKEDLNVVCILWKTAHRLQ